MGTTPFLRIALRVAMATMHFHISLAGLYLGNLSFALRGPCNNLATMKNCPEGAR